MERSADFLLQVDDSRELLERLRGAGRRGGNPASLLVEAGLHLPQPLVECGAHVSQIGLQPRGGALFAFQLPGVEASLKFLKERLHALLAVAQARRHAPLDFLEFRSEPSFDLLNPGDEARLRIRALRSEALLQPLQPVAQRVLERLDLDDRLLSRLANDLLDLHGRVQKTLADVGETPFHVGQGGGRETGRAGLGGLGRDLQHGVAGDHQIAIVLLDIEEAALLVDAEPVDRIPFVVGRTEGRQHRTDHDVVPSHGIKFVSPSRRLFPPIKSAATWSR